MAEVRFMGSTTQTQENINFDTVNPELLTINGLFGVSDIAEGFLSPGYASTFVFPDLDWSGYELMSGRLETIMFNMSFTVQMQVRPTSHGCHLSVAVGIVVGAAIWSLILGACGTFVVRRMLA